MNEHLYCGFVQARRTMHMRWHQSRPCVILYLENGSSHSFSLHVCVCNYVRLHVCARTLACMWMCANLCEKSFHSHLPFLLCIWGLWRYVQIIHRLRTEKTLFLHSRKLCRRKKDVTTLKTSGAYHEIFFIHVQMR